MSPKQTLKRIPVDRLVGHEYNRVLDQVRVKEMAASIRQVGLLTPLTVTEHLTDYNRWLILDGHYRHAALQDLRMSQVLCTVRHGLDEDLDQQLVLMVISNCQRVDMAPMDRAEWFGLLKRTMPVSEISLRTGLTESRIYDSLSLLDLDAETRQMVREGAVRVGEASRAVKQVRAATRAGTAVGTAPKKRAVRVEPAHFTRKHPLSAKAGALCTHVDASVGLVRPTVGGIACGQCWEQTIRDDERRARP